MTLSLGLPHGHQRSTAQQQEIREARRMLREKVRGDWDYPALPRYQTRAPTPGYAVEGKVAGFKFHHTASSLDIDSLLQGTTLERLDFEPLEWREREQGSDDEWSGDENENGSFATTVDAESKKTVAYQFSHLDDVGAPVPPDQQLARKRKRRKRFEEELCWNDGLAHWMARRDIWCAARTTAEVDALHTARVHPEVALEIDSTSRSAQSTPSTSSSTPRSSTSSSLTTDAVSSPASSTSTVPDPSLNQIPPSPTTYPPPPTVEDKILLPIPPPLLPNHPIRKRITPPLYPEIYTKIVQQARSPSVPINLHVLIQALVQGWKDDGEWPPKTAGVAAVAAEKSIGRRRRKDKGKAKDKDEGIGKVLTPLKAVGRALRIGSSTSPGGGGGGEATG